MADDGKKKSLKDKLKSSPAAKQLKEEGPMKVAKTLGSLAKEGMGEVKDKVLDTIMPLDNTHMQTRQGHFEQAHDIAVRGEDVPHAEGMIHTYHSNGMSAGTFRDGNVSSIMNGFANRARKLPPEGY
jgi:hypothetical protein